MSARVQVKQARAFMARRSFRQWLGNLMLAGAAISSGATAQPGSASFASEGDSISVSWGGNYTGIYASSHPTVRHCALATGGGIDAIAARVDKVLACNPKVLTILVGAHGLAERTGTDYFLSKLFAYSDELRAHGIKVAVATILPEYHPGNASYDVIFNKRRAEANAAIRAAVGIHIDAVIDFAADPVMGLDSAAKDASLYRDGTHPTDGCGMGCGGQGKLAVIYAPVVDRLLGISR
jgi:GDSL-like Lipase/Acylhydrolase family